MNGTPYTVVGVMPPKFHYPDDVDVWQRLRVGPDAAQPRRALHGSGRAAEADGTTFEQAQSAVDALGPAAAEPSSRNTNRGWGSRLVPLLDEQLGYYRPALMVLFGAVGAAAA